MSVKKKLWTIGVVVAGIGVVLVRVVSPRYDQPELKLIIFALGTIVAIAGLGVIMYAIKKGLK